MSNQAPVLHVISGPRDYLAMAGAFAMDLGCRPRWKFVVVDGDRRRFGEKTARPALELKILQGEKP